MFGPATAALFAALRVFVVLTAGGLPVEAVPQFYSNTTNTTLVSTSNYWLANIQRQGVSAFNPNANDYKVFRNVKDYGATGDGKTDDTEALNNAISIGSRCAESCNSSTTTPALVYFPPGTYLVSKPINQLYYTQFVGDAITLPTIKAAANFTGIAVMDADPYGATGNWYSNRDNFLRQIRNFVIDLTAMNANAGTGIHWQVAQATSLQNIRFDMIKGTTKSANNNGTNNQQGIFMENGSGGFMTDLTFNGGKYGAWMGNQQFTTRNLTFNDCQTAVFMNFNWAWTFKSISVNNCGIGIDMAQGGLSQTVGSVMVLDSKFTETSVGISTAYATNQTVTNGTLVLDNVDFTGCAAAISNPLTNRTILPGIKVGSWIQGKEYSASASSTGSGSGSGNGNGNGNGYNGNGNGNGYGFSNRTGSVNSTANGKQVHGALTRPAPKPATLLNTQGAVFERAKPQYEELPASAFVSVKSCGAKGDGITDDTEAIQKVLDSVTRDQIVYFDHGAYIVSRTIKVPKDIRITGEIWPMIMASGTAFQNMNNPVPVFQVGQVGDTGSVEMSDLIFTTMGPQPGAIIVQWNVAEPKGNQGSSGMWDVHFRIGGAAGTKLQSDTCANHNITAPADPNCEAAFLLLHVTKTASIYLENNWFWVADHDLDIPGTLQINIFNGRGVFIESAKGPVWMYGTASEHSQLYNYNIANAENIYMALIQTETPYMQANPNALTPFGAKSEYLDPTFEHCTTDACRKSTGLRIVNSSDVLVYGAGLYSFFDNYKQECLATESCQEDMVTIENSNNVSLFGLSTKASTNMVTVHNQGVVPERDNRDTFCSTVALFQLT
ncbi:MAG: hypothetical protein M1835_005679 [Candelina submexicana]|nr:MAG: hypothetical protein M1835_005679 [Candelina submexicana]